MHAGRYGAVITAMLQPQPFQLRCPAVRTQRFSYSLHSNQERSHA
jgi:hypothetical protein